MKAKRLQSRATEKEQKRLHIPTIDRTTGEPAPFVVVVQGPPQVRVHEAQLFLWVLTFMYPAFIPLILLEHSCCTVGGEVVAD